MSQAAEQEARPENTLSILKTMRDTNVISQYHYCLVLEELRKDWVIE